MGKECLPHGRMGSLAWSVAKRGPLSQDSGIPTVTPSLPLRRGEFRCESVQEGVAKLWLFKSVFGVKLYTCIAQMLLVQNGQTVVQHVSPG